MAAVWSDQHRYELMLEIETLVCEALSSRGLVPAEAAAEIRKKASVDAERVADIEAEVHHDVIAFVTAAAESVGAAGRYLHFGMTSSDVLDSAFALQLVESADLLVSGVRELMQAIAEQARLHRWTPMVGRSHGVHAQPITFGLKLAGWYSELSRDLERLLRAREDVATGKLSGAVGTYGVNGPEIEKEVLDQLGLSVEPVATQVVPRDRHAHFFSTLAIVAGSLERFATEVRHLQRTEVAELFEPFGQSQKGSSAMPHKRNPILAENICGLARVVRSNAIAAFDNIALWHERDISHSSVERVIAPDSTIALDFMLARLTGLVRGFEVNAGNMQRNLDMTSGRLFSERVLLKLVDSGVERDRAYRWVQRCAMADGSFADNVRADPDISAKLTSDELSAVFDLRHALSYIDEIMDRVIEEGS